MAYFTHPLDILNKYMIFRFEKKCIEVVVKALNLSEKARREGLLALEESINEETYKDRNIFYYGMRLIIDGTDASFIDKLLSNMISHEKNKQKKLLKELQKQACLLIQEGTNTRLIEIMLLSLLNDKMAIRIKKYLDENIIKD